MAKPMAAGIRICVAGFGTKVRCRHDNLGHLIVVNL
jgi:hypothetical protein